MKQQKLGIYEVAKKALYTRTSVERLLTCMCVMNGCTDYAAASPRGVARGSWGSGVLVPHCEDNATLAADGGRTCQESERKGVS